MQLESKKLLEDIRQSTVRIFEFTEDKAFSDYVSNALLCSGVERQLTIIGEVLNQALKIDPTLSKKITHIRQIINLGNIVVHGYAAIENETVWGILQNDLPTLHDEVRALLSMTAKIGQFELITVIKVPAFDASQAFECLWPFEFRQLGDSPVVDCL